MAFVLSCIVFGLLCRYFCGFLCLVLLFFPFLCFHLRQGIAISPRVCANVLPALAFWAAAACFAAADML